MLIVIFNNVFYFNYFFLLNDEFIFFFWTDFFNTLRKCFFIKNYNLEILNSFKNSYEKYEKSKK